MYPYWGWPAWVLWVSGFSRSVEGRREEWLPFKGSTGVFQFGCGSLEMEFTIVDCTVGVLWSICEAHVGCMHFWRMGDAVTQCPYLTLQSSVKPLLELPLQLEMDCSERKMGRISPQDLEGLKKKHNQNQSHKTRLRLTYITLLN